MANIRRLGEVPPPDLEDLVSQQLICPISQHIMELPVITPGGHTYDRESIIQWLVRRPVDPLSSLPLAVSALCPNRALQEEVLEQLRKVKTAAEMAGDPRIAREAQEKLGRVQAAQSSTPAHAALFAPMSCRCARWANWWGLLAQRTAMSFLMSLGGVSLCILLDIWKRRGTLKESSGSAPAMSTNGDLPAVFRMLKVAYSLHLPFPEHWGYAFRIAAGSLQVALVLPWLPHAGSMLVGALCSAAHFVQAVHEDRWEQRGRAARHNMFCHFVNICSGIVGYSSLALFIRLWLDRR